jgi:enoyl-[acyl-carrier-protein] reductase (NADH)
VILNDFKGKAVLVTGGTKGLGLAIGLAFGAEGAQVYLTNRWGSADEAIITKRFADVGAPAPVILEADASNADDTVALLETIKKKHDSIEVFVSNVSFAQVNKKKGLEGLKRRYLHKALEYGTWPFVGYLQQIKEIFGKYPRYSLGTSCDGPDTYYPGYDYVAVTKAVMETFAKYIGKHLWIEQRATVNIIRSRPVSTDSLEATFGPEYEPFLRKWHSDRYFIELEQVGSAALALCSGLMDAMTGQIILLDKGVAFSDNLMRMFAEREDYGLEP